MILGGIKMIRQIMKWIAKCLLTSAAAVAAVAGVTLIIGYINYGRLTLDTALTANYFVSVIALLLGVSSLVSAEHGADQPSSRLGRLAAVSTSLAQSSSSSLEEMKAPPATKSKKLRLEILPRLRFLLIGIGILAITLSAQFLLGLSGVI